MMHPIPTVAVLLLAAATFVESFSVGSSDRRSIALGNGYGSLQSTPSLAKYVLTQTRSSSRVCLSMASNPYFQIQARKDIRLPLLLDIISEEGSEPQYDVPLPNSHLPPELTTASLYGLKLDVPLHRSVIQDAVSTARGSSSSPIVEESCCYGHIVYKPDVDSLIGSIGCASEILIGAPSNNEEELVKDMDRDDSGPLFVLARGSYRFRVKEIVKSIPYPVAIVDEILDENVAETEEEDDEDGDIYDTIPSSDLVREILVSLDKILKAQAEETEKPLSPLEKSILEDADSSAPMEQAIQRRFDAEEKIAVFQTFVSSLLDIAPDARDRKFSVAMIAGELANLPSDIRVKMLVTTNGVERLRIVLRELSSMLSMDSAKKITKSLSLGGGGDGMDAERMQEAEDEQKKLQVGTPNLPAWADQIQKGIRVEYFWSDVEGWCLGTVDEDPVRIMDEIIVTVKFDDDGSIHKIPFTGESKVRWRPPKGNTGAFD